MKSSLFKLLKVTIIVMLLITFCSTSGFCQALIADHTSSDEFSNIPDSIITFIRGNYYYYYAHTSHGSQIMTGLDMVYAEDNLYQEPYFYERSDDLGHVGDTSWVPYMRTYLASNPDCNMVMFSWCGGCSDNSEAGMNIYLNKMNELESDYPSHTFIYMTGHLDGGGITGNLYLRNNQIRDYCNANDKILFDFADIESYDPDGTYYPDENDACGWCETWCASHSCPSCAGCAHSHCFNCYRKGKAWWWMMAKISGWQATLDTIPDIVSFSPEQNEMNVGLSSDISVQFDIPMDETTLTSSSINLFSKYKGKLPGTFSYDAPTNTVLFNPTTDFVVGDVIQVVITDAVLSAAGVPLTNGFGWSFTCEVSAGNAQFGDTASFAIPTYPRQVKAADLNGDNNVDIVVVNSDGFHVMLGTGTGALQPFVTYTTPSYSYSMTLADVNNDGYPEVAIAGESSEYYGYTSIYINNGDGTFGDPISYDGGGEGDITSADLNLDGYLDLIVVQSFLSSNIYVFLNNGNETFTTDTIYTAELGSQSVAAEDFNGDGYFDIVVGWSQSNTVEVFLSTGPGRLSEGVEYLTSYAVQSLYAADLDNDGDVDIVTGDETSEYMGIASYLYNNGDGTFGNLSGAYVEGGAVAGIYCTDLNNNGFNDIACVAWGEYFRYMLNQGDGSFGAVQTETILDRVRDMTCADMDNDGDMDIISMHDGPMLVTVTKNGMVINPPYCGDANNDGSLDVGDAVYLINYAFKGGPAPNPVCQGDANNDSDVNVGDAIFIVNYAFKGGPSPGTNCCD
ncbi:MAG: VCBS repeat-containing protein [candidate division Zixibacteria bacterium]|nr:VCBS repeat-containing protein [candidate division Zixibacteria bacterium]